MSIFKRTSDETEITISNYTLLRVIGMTIAAILLFFAIKKSAYTLTLIGVSFFLSLALNSPVKWLANSLPGKKKNRRNLATAISVGIILLLLGGFLTAIVPPLAKQTASFISSVPSLLDDTKNGRGPIGQFVRTHNLEPQVEDISKQLSSKIGSISNTALTTVAKIGSSLFAVLTVIVMTVMMLLEGPAWRQVFINLIPSRKRARAEQIARDMNRVVQGYVNGQVTLAAIAAVLIVPVFFIMGVGYPLALMVIVFICGLIPMVGHTIGAIIATTVALFTSLPAAMVVLGYYILYQQIENYAVQPKIQSNSTNMSPLLVFISVIIGANFGGLLGGLVAIPVAGCIRILVLDFLEYRDILPSKTVKDAKTKGGTI